MCTSKYYKPISITNNVLSFFCKEYPLIRLFEYGDDVLIYDAKPHFACILSRKELDVLVDFLKNVPEDQVINNHSIHFDAKYLKQLLVKYNELRYCGAFLQGPLDEVSSIDHDIITNQCRYFDENIVLRKFCLEVTEDCNFRCTYCRNTTAVEYRKHSKTNMTEEIAFKGIDYYFLKYTTLYSKLSEEKKELLLQIAPPTLSWYGGEPLLNFKLVKNSAKYFKSLPWYEYRIKTSDLKFSINTNLSAMNDSIVNFLVDNNVLLYASLDGPEEEHNKCRVFENGEGTFNTAYTNLQKIKRHNEVYFREKVTIFGVYTDKHDYDKCIDFIRNIGASSFRYFPAEYSGSYVPNIDKEYEKYAQFIENDLMDFKRNLAIWSKDIDNDMNFFSNIMKFADVSCDNPFGSNSLMALISCPMGFDNLMIDASGNYMICHKTDGSMPIGNCVSGLDFDKVVDLYQRYNTAINNPECKKCWNVRFCGICAAKRMSAGTFQNPTSRECDFLRLESSYDFLCFIYLSINHGDILEKIFDHRNDKRKYVSYIDINKL